MHYENTLRKTLEDGIDHVFQRVVPHGNYNVAYPKFEDYNDLLPTAEDFDMYSQWWALDKDPVLTRDVLLRAMGAWTRVFDKHGVEFKQVLIEEVNGMLVYCDEVERGILFKVKVNTVEPAPTEESTPEPEGETEGESETPTEPEA